MKNLQLPVDSHEHLKYKRNMRAEINRKLRPNRLGCYQRFMKTLCIIFFSVLIVGCASTQQSASLTAEQAKAVAMRLANDKASTLYHCRPFRDDQPARFVADRWEWQERQGYGLGDLEARVSFAANGSAPTVEVLLLDGRTLASRMF